MKLSTEKTLHVPEVMDKLATNNMPTARPSPSFTGPVEKTCYEQPSKSVDCAAKAAADDLAFNLMRQHLTTATSWTVFNESLTKADPPKTTVGYMPIIQAPAHEYDTLTTVVEHCLKVSVRL